MKFIIAAGAGVTIATCVLSFAGPASAGNQIRGHEINTLAQPHLSSVIRLAENDKKDAHDHSGNDHKDHADDDGHKSGEAAHHQEEGHQHVDGDEHADHKDGHDSHDEHIKKGTNAE